jgi:vancomycin permeability regulator SanA
MWLTVAVCLAGFPFAQMCCFGLTDYRREANAAVVFGARVYADGRLSLALADRVQTACTLYRDGLVRKVILSGGPGDGETHETEAMRRLALELGVAADDIMVDEAGVNTEATVRNTCAMFEQERVRRVIAVSHFYHLPRIKLAYARQGREVYTVPADETRVLMRLPWYMAREVAALWVYYLRPLTSA